MLIVGAGRHEEGEKDHYWNRSNHDNHRIDERLDKNLIIEHADIVIQTNKGKVSHRIIEETGHQAHNHWGKEKNDKEDQYGSQKGVGYHCFPHF